MSDVVTGSLPVTRAAVLLKIYWCLLRFLLKSYFSDLEYGEWISKYLPRFLNSNTFVKWCFNCIFFLFDFVSYFPVCNPSWSCLSECASYLNLFLWFWSVTISRSYIYGAGGLINFVLFKGAWRSIHSRMIFFKMSSWSHGLSKLYAIENSSCLKSSMYFWRLKFVMPSINDGHSNTLEYNICKIFNNVVNYLISLSC